MPATLRLTRALRLAAVLFSLGTVAACATEPDDDDEPDIVAVRFLVGGTQQVTINDNGAQTGTATLGTGASTIVAIPLGSGGADLTNALAGDFELRVTPVTNNVTFARTATFAGTLTRTGTGTATVRVSMYHRGQDHEDFGPFNLTLN